MKVRSATLDDVDKLIAIASRGWGAAKWTRPEYERGLEASGGRVWLVAQVESGELAGFVVARQTLDELEIENIAVDPERQRRGAASFLLNTLVQTANRRNVSSMVLEVRESNRPARSFYEKQGFFEEGRRPRYYSDPIEDAVLYRKNLSVAAPENG